MGKFMKILMTGAIIIGIIFFSLGVLSAKEHGLSILEIGRTIRSNLEELNIHPGYTEFSSIPAEASGLAGSLDSSSGNIRARIREEQTGDLALTTESGNVDLVHEGWDYGYELTSLNGDVDIMGDGEGEPFRDAGAPLHQLKISSTRGNVLLMQVP